MILLTVLNITVTNGTINGLIFYATVLIGNHEYFPTQPAKFSRLLWMFISWLNLSSGLDGCAFDGLTGYLYIWLSFGYTFYLLFIELVIILLSRRFTFFTRLFGRNVLNVLSTLLFLAHTQLSYACFRTFQFARLYESTSNVTRINIVWSFDGNLPYLGIRHALLFIVALVCSVVVVLFVFSLLLVQCLQKWSDRWCLHWVERLRPFYETFTGPCHDNYRFWPGLLYILRTALFALNFYFTSYEKHSRYLKMIAISSVCILIMSLACIFPHGVYKRWLLNVLEFSFLLNLCITCVLLGLYHHPTHAIYFSVPVVMITWCGILLYHIHQQIRSTRGWKILVTWFSVRAQKFHLKRRYSTSQETDERALLLPQPLPPVVGFKEYREQLLED